MRNPERILLVRLSHLGDVVHALGVFHALHAAYPAAEIAWAVQPEFSELVSGLPGLARTIPFERRGGLKAWVRLRRQLRDFRPDWTIDAQGNAKSGCAALLSGARRRAASARRDWQEPWAADSANDRAPALDPPARHAMQRMAVLVRHVAPHSELPLRTDAGLSPDEVRAGERELARRLPRGGSAILLHLSTPGDVRGWPVEHWAHLVAALCNGGRRVLLVSGPAEATTGHALLHRFDGVDGVSHWIAQRGLRALAALFQAAARRGLSLVACDSGPMHLAAAHGLSVVALAGPQDEARTGPWPLIEPHSGAREPGRHVVIRARTPPACAPCLARRCRHPEGAVCMLHIRPEDVLAALTAGE